MGMELKSLCKFWNTLHSSPPYPDICISLFAATQWEVFSQSEKSGRKIEICVETFCQYSGEWVPLSPPASEAEPPSNRCQFSSGGNKILPPSPRCVSVSTRLQSDSWIFQILWRRSEIVNDGIFQTEHLQNMPKKLFIYVCNFCRCCCIYILAKCLCVQHQHFQRRRPILGRSIQHWCSGLPWSSHVNMSICQMSTCQKVNLIFFTCQHQWLSAYLLLSVT